MPSKEVTSEGVEAMLEARLGARLEAMLEARMFRGSWENIETGGWLGEGLGTTGMRWLTWKRVSPNLPGGL